MSDTLFSISFNTTTAIILLAIALIGALLGFGIAWMRYRGEIMGLNAALDAELRTQADHTEALERMHDAFGQLSSDALSRNNAMFLDLASQSLAQQATRVDARAEIRERSVASMVKPLADALSQTRNQVERLEKERREAHGALSQHLTHLVDGQRALHKETRSLATAMRRPEVRGRWGELTLRRLVELAGLSEHCDFSEQTHTNTGDGAVRPDLIVHLPGGRQVIIDVKTPLDAFLSAAEAPDDSTRNEALNRHAGAVKKRIDELAAKSYWQHFDDSLDFVILFLPGEQFLAPALDRDGDLLERALARRVIPATPTSLVALLRAIAFGWRQEALTSNAKEIRKSGEDLLERLSLLTEHLDKLGRSVDTTVGHFNRLTGSFQARVMPAARRFEQFGIEPPRTMTEPEMVNRPVRGQEPVADNPTDSAQITTTGDSESSVQ